MRAMATQVEVGSALPSLTTRSELTGEVKLRHTFASSLSSVSNKPGELSTSLSPLILEERSKFGTPLRPATMPPVASRPRLTPKPFSREKSFDTFSVVRPPVTIFKPSNVAPNPPVFAKTFEDMTATKGLTGNVPPLVDQKLIEDKSPSELVPNMPFDSSPQANTVILFETGKSEKGRMFTPEKSHLGSPQICGSLQAPEGHLAPSKSEVFCRTAGIHRQLSLSSESRPVSWNPCISLEKKDNLTAASEGKGEVMERQHSASVSSADEVQLRLKQRPVSAIFLESLKDQKPCCLEVSDEKSLPEKTWVRKPRPLSMDLTAKFENRDLSSQRKSCPTEIKEMNVSPDPTKQGSVAPFERWTKNETGALGRAEPSKSTLKSPGPFAGFASVLNPKPFPSEEASSHQGTQKDFPHVSARDRKCLWESRLRRHEEQNASEMEAEATAEKVPEPSSVKGQSVKERAALSPKDPGAARKNCMHGSDTENQSLRDVEKPIDVPDRSANDATSGNVESQPESPGEESRILNIQQRIKELTAETTDAKAGSLRLSFRSRPLSADLTKLFSSHITAGELKAEKLAELNKKPANKTQESPEIKATLVFGTDSGEAHAGGVPWRPQQQPPVKILPLQRDGSLARERQSGALQGDSPASLAGHDVHTSSTFPAEKACIKTVRATMFEHHMQRHNVTADHLAAEPPSQPTNEALGNCRESWMGKAAESAVFSEEMPQRQLDRLVDAKKPGKANALTKERVLQETTWKKPTSMEKWEYPSPKHAGDSLVCQRVEPKYEILQTVGKRAQSEAIATVCEDKAVTLRSRRSLKERRRLGESFVDASWSRSLDLKRDSWKEDGFVSKRKDGVPTTAEADTSRAFNASLGQRAFSVQAELDKNQIGQKHVTAKVSCLTNRDRGGGATEDRVCVASAEVEKEKSRGKTEGSKVLKHLPGNSEAGPGRMDGGDTGADISQSWASGSPRKPEGHLSGSGNSPWQTVGSKVLPHHSTDRRTYEQEEAKVSGLRTCPTARRAQETSDAAGHRPEGHSHLHFEAEEQGKRSGHCASAGKASERWRRKTLSHDFRFEGAGGTLAEEGTKALIRRDSLQFHEGSIAKKSRKPRGTLEPREGTSVSPSSPEGRFKDQPSPSTPKVTYFAVTYQIPNEAEGSSDKEFAHQSRWFSSLVEHASFASNAGAPRRSHPSSDLRSCAAISEAPGSLGRHFGRDWEEAGGGGGDASALLKKGPFKYPVSEGREESWRSLERQMEDAKDRTPGTEHLIHAVVASSSSPGDQKSPSYFRPLHQGGGDHLGQRKPSDYSHGGSMEKNADNYRSRVLDIDALMAEYKEDSLKPSVTRDRREGEDSSLFPWEKGRRSSLEKTSFSYSRKESHGWKDSPRSPRQDVPRPETMCASEKERLDSRELSSLQQRGGKFSPSPGARPPGLGLPADATSSKKKKTFILDEEPGASLMLWSPGAKHGEYSPLSLDLQGEAGFAPHPSSALTNSLLQKGPGPKQQQQAADVPPPEGEGHSRRRSSLAGSPRKSSSAATAASAGASPDAKGKTHLAKAEGSRPGGPEGWERREQHRFRQSFPPEQADDARQSRQRSASQQRFLPCEEKKDLEKERSRPDPESPGASSSPHLTFQRRSRSFYGDRRVDHWATDQLKQCFGRPAAEAKDTETLVREADSQYGTWSDRQHSGDSLVPESPSSDSNVASARKQPPPSSRLSSFSSQTDPASTTDPHDSSRGRRSTSLDRSSTDVESADGTEGPAPAEACPDFSFLEQTPVLDSSALKTRVQLSKRRRQHRAPISHLLRRSSGGEAEEQPSVTEEASSAWMFKDSTAPHLDSEEKSVEPEVAEGEAEGKQPPPSEKPPVSQAQRLPVFPGLDHSALKVQLRRRQEPEGAGDVSPAQASRSPKSVYQPGGPGVRVLPAGTEKEERLEEASPSPQWLKELKSKKRQSQYENQV
ncbi:uncharacterized protein KIAA1671 homolog [Heteronotia binoei]|uniref:uncharacterized protein KIAA1671 homolog n=1 Tax=Heteronotia binoei TaxID=13085 RepID=UPI00292DE808|nr:uncharacterized protein KIAA1671 homolog [Heteronotia binoei]